MSLQSFLFRFNCKRNDDKRDAGLSTPPGVLRCDNLCYGPDKKWQRLDLYRPRGAAEPLPVIVSVHGGGWVYGDKERYQYYCMSLVEHGFAVVNFTYRLAPEHKFPAQLQDVDLVFHWLLRHAERYHLDARHVFALGDSAGAHLLGLYCCACGDADFAAACALQPPEGFRPTAVALNCGVYHIDPPKPGERANPLLADLLPNKGTAEELRQISVLEHLNESFPPALVMTCEGDFLAEAAPPLVQRLESLGVPAEYRYYGDRDHVLGHVFHCNMRLAEAARCNREECDFFRSFLPQQRA